jgi:hypothetical protein
LFVTGVSDCPDADASGHAIDYPTANDRERAAEIGDSRDGLIDESFQTERALR